MVTSRHRASSLPFVAQRAGQAASGWWIECRLTSRSNGHAAAPRAAHLQDVGHIQQSEDAGPSTVEPGASRNRLSVQPSLGGWARTPRTNMGGDMRPAVLRRGIPIAVVLIVAAAFLLAACALASSADSGQATATPAGGGGAVPTWTPQSVTGSAYLNSVYFVDGHTGWVAGTKGAILKTSDAGLTWSRQPTGTYGILWSVFFISHRVGWAVGGSSTTDRRHHPQDLRRRPDVAPPVFAREACPGIGLVHRQGAWMGSGRQQQPRVRRRSPAHVRRRPALARREQGFEPPLLCSALRRRQEGLDRRR